MKLRIRASRRLSLRRAESSTGREAIRVSICFKPDGIPTLSAATRSIVDGAGDLSASQHVASGALPRAHGPVLRQAGLQA